MADRNAYKYTPDRKTTATAITPTPIKQTPTKTLIKQTPSSQTTTTPTRPIQRYRQRNQAFNPYWNNPSGFIQVNQTPASNVVNDIANVDNDYDIADTTQTDNIGNTVNNKMTNDDDKTKYAAILRDEMEWTKKPNKTPSILEVLEYKAAVIEGLRRCPYRGNKKGHTFLIETEGELQERIKDTTASITERPKEPIEPIEPKDEDEDAKWDRYDRKEKRYRTNVIKYELAEAYDKQLKDLIMSTFPGCANDLLD